MVRSAPAAPPLRARPHPGRVVAVLGPTNTGKTHYAIERMLGHSSGVIGLPLRLLAREIYDRIAKLRGPASVALVTGEERIVPPHPRWHVCTVEAMPRDQEFDFLAVDEIQLCADPERGHVFTDRLLRARGRSETLFLGADTMRPILRELLPDAEFVSRPRFSNLSYTGSKKLGRLPRRSAIVGFSADAVYGIAELIRRQRGGAAVVLGALSPRTRNAQVALYQSGEVDFLVATDAIGMGLNMDVDHVAFSNLRKFDGHHYRPLAGVEIAQIAGRAGRHMNDGTFGTTGEAGLLDPTLIEQVETHRFDPVRTLQWRNPNPDFSNLKRLIASLEAPPPTRGLVRAREAPDLTALKMLSRDEEVQKIAANPGAIRRLWQVCQIPDFRKTSADEHARLLRRIYLHLSGEAGVLEEDWVRGQVERLDRTDGEVDTLANRIAHIRTWTFVSNRGSWLAHPKHWQERTRDIEDRLSDALHATLTQRFVDRRTSVLMRRLRQREDLIAAISGDGEVLVEGEFVGRLEGFLFAEDPRAEGIHGRTLRQAAEKALGPEIARRAADIVDAPDADLRLTDAGDFLWRGARVGHLASGGEVSVLAPNFVLIHDELLSAAARDRVRARLAAWLDGQIVAHLGPLLALRRPEGLTGLARGVAFRLSEALGAVERARIEDEIRGLDQTDRAALRKLGVRFGERYVFVPSVLKPAAARLKLLLWAAATGRSGPVEPVRPGLVSLSVDQGVDAEPFWIQGFVLLGPRAVRLDIVERLLDRIRPLKGKTPFLPTPEMAMDLGCAPDEIPGVLRALGFRPVPVKDEAGQEQTAWRAPRPHHAKKPDEKAERRRAARDSSSPFAALRVLKPSMESAS